MSGRLTLRDFLKKFPVVSRITVKWGDMDAYQHVNNTVYFKYQEVARLRYFGVLMSHIKSSEFDTKSFMNGTGIGPIMSDTYCQFKLPLEAPDKLLVGSSILNNDITKDRYKLSHAVWSMKHKRVVAEGFGTVVSYDFKNKRACDIPEPLVRAIAKVQAGNLEHLHDAIAANKDLEDEF
jgi:acyl-CoA thioester hydrolase